jgi:hypothetical protein
VEIEPSSPTRIVVRICSDITLELSKNTMTKSILLMSPLEDTYELLCLTCLDLPVNVIHTKDCHSGIVAARSCKPSIIFIDATDTLSYNGWVMARIINTDTRLKEVPIVVFSDDAHAAQLARKSCVEYQLPRHFSVPYVFSLVERSLGIVRGEQRQFLRERVSPITDPGLVTPAFDMIQP